MGSSDVISWYAAFELRLFFTNIPIPPNNISNIGSPRPTDRTMMITTDNSSAGGFPKPIDAVLLWN